MSEKPEALFAKMFEALSSKHTYTEAEVRLVMLGMQAEIDRARAECEALRADAAQAVRSERSRCFELAKLAISYAGDADWSRVDAVICLIERPAAVVKEQNK